MNANSTLRKLKKTKQKEKILVLSTKILNAQATVRNLLYRYAHIYTKIRICTEKL